MLAVMSAMFFVAAMLLNLLEIGLQIEVGDDLELIIQIVSEL